ncbi:DUF2158 domain-containing protein [Microvirga sp. STS02]|uniref:YodC family protein n=1 Tax=Hymenobacter negativus TaxID=2795026 RepID=UPI0018DC8203|nr:MULTISPECIES: DUF2158 domain-containing protein [Bacteria]MBH8569366.1 DUF2158 domain-containing protein [Hymenobacter negativus]MBR7209100.1 DUF2158 domain-containing protein [Microvirga sp. STS02]
MAEESKFAPGDIVRVKSGGPVMTVVNHVEDGRYYCTWWQPKRGELVFDFFYPVILEKATEPDHFPVVQ